MTVVDRYHRPPKARRAALQSPVAKRIVEHLGRFAILTLALTGLLALAGVQVFWAASISFMIVDVGTLVWLEKSQTVGQGIPKFAARLRLTPVQSKGNFLN